MGRVTSCGHQPSGTGAAWRLSPRVYLPGSRGKRRQIAEGRGADLRPAGQQRAAPDPSTASPRATPSQPNDDGRHGPWRSRVRQRCICGTQHSPTGLCASSPSRTATRVRPPQTCLCADGVLDSVMRQGQCLQDTHARVVACQRHEKALRASTVRQSKKNRSSWCAAASCPVQLQPCCTVTPSLVP